MIHHSNCNNCAIRISFVYQLWAYITPTVELLSVAEKVSGHIGAPN